MIAGIEVRRVQEETFRYHIEGVAGSEVLIRSGALRETLHRCAMDKVIDLTFPADETLESIVQRHGLEPERMASMTEEEAKEPVITGIFPPIPSFPREHHVLIDGGHRRWFWAKRGVHVLKGWAVPEVIWRQFVLDESSMFVLRHDPTGMGLPQRGGKWGG